MTNMTTPKLSRFLVALSLVLAVGFVLQPIFLMVRAAGASFGSGNIVDGKNITSGDATYIDPITAQNGNTVRMRIKAVNKGSDAAANTKVTFDFSNAQAPRATVTADGVSEVSDSLSISPSGATLQLVPGSGKKYGPPSCSAGCAVSDTEINSGVLLGTVNAGEAASYQVTVEFTVTGTPTTTPVRTTLRSGNILDAGNRTDRTTGWQDPVAADPGEIVEFQTKVINDGQSAAQDVVVRAELPITFATSTTVRSFVSSSTADSVNDTAVVNVSGTQGQRLVYLPGHALKYGPGCTNGCALPDSIHTTGVSIGELPAGQQFQVTFKVTVSNVPPVTTPSPSPTVTPTPSPSPSPSPTPTVTPSPSPSPSPSPTPTVTPTPSPSPSPSPTPTPKGKFKICKFEDTNGNGTRDSGETGLSWDFVYRLNDGVDHTYATRAGSWYEIWNQNKGCGDWIEVPENTLVKAIEKENSDWQITTDKEQTATIHAGNEITFHFGNRKKSQPTPTPSSSPTPTPTPLICNSVCQSNSDCQSGHVCHQDGSQKYCRHPENLGSNSCDTRKTGGFFIRKYHDENGNGHQDTNEKGLSWKFQWDQNADNNWRDYETFENKLGEGGVVSFPEGTQIRIREKAVDGWSATTASEVTIRIRAGENQLMVFGNWRGKPQVLGTSTVTKLPKTGPLTFAGPIASVAMYAAGMWLKKKGL